MKVVSNDVLKYTKSTIDNHMLKLDKQLKDVELWKERKILLESLKQQVNNGISNDALRKYVIDKLTTESNIIDKKLNRLDDLGEAKEKLQQLSAQVKKNI